MKSNIQGGRAMDGKRQKIIQLMVILVEFLLGLIALQTG